MTKQLKKGLVAVLIVLMAVLVGFTSNAVIGASRAADDLPEDAKPIVETFNKNVEILKNFNLSEDQMNAEYLLTGILGDKTENVDDEGEPIFKNQDTATAVWKAYNAAKTQIPELTKFAYKDFIPEDLQKVFNAYDDVFTKAGAYKNLIRFTNEMHNIKVGKAPYNTYDASHELVEKMTEDIKTWKEEGRAYEESMATEEKVHADTLHYYIYHSSFVGFHYYEYKGALDAMNKFEKRFEDIDELIDGIKYYNEEDLTLRPDDEVDTPFSKDEKNHTIVLDSEESINAVTEKLEKKDDKDTDFVDADDRKYIEGYEDYLQAVKDLQAWKDLIKEVNDKIDAAYAAKTDKKVYYTVRDLYYAAKAAYDKLKESSKYEQGDSSQQNYNDLQKGIDKDHVDKYNEMTKYLTEDTNGLYARIKTLEEKIAELPALEDASYTIEYRTQIEEAEKLFKALDDDIVEHDEWAYPLVIERNKLSVENGELIDAMKKINAKRSAEGYNKEADKDRAADDKVLAENPVKLSVNSARMFELQSQLIQDDRYMHRLENDELDFSRDFIVTGYDKLRAARAQYDEWTKVIKDRIKDVEELIRLQSEEDGKGVGAVLSRLRPVYEDTTGEFWSGKDWMAHKLAFLYASDKEPAQEGYKQIYVKDEVNGDIYDTPYGEKYNFLVKSPYYSPDGGEVKDCTNYDVIAYFLAKWDEVQKLVGDIDARITNLNDKVKKEGCVYGFRAELIDLYADFKAFEHFEGTDNDYTNWITGNDILRGLYKEYIEEEKLVRVWAALMEEKNIELPVGVADWADIEELEAAFKAIVHYTGDTAAIAENPIDFGKYLEQTSETYNVPNGNETRTVTQKYADMQADREGKYTDIFTDKEGNVLLEGLVLDYSEEYDIYHRAIVAKETLKKAIDDLAKRMSKYDEDTNPTGIDTSGEVELNKVDEWTKNVREVEATFKGMADGKVDGDIDYTGSHAKFFTGEEATYAEAYANYLLALQQIEKYEVEAAIEKIQAEYNYTNDNKTAGTLKEDTLTLADGQAISDAWTLHNNFLSKYADEIKKLDPDNNEEDKKTRDDFLLNKQDVHQSKDGYDIRNDWKLHLCWERLNEINEELNKWMRDVIDLYDEIDDNATITEIYDKLKEMYTDFDGDILDEDKIAKEAYPLAIAPTDKKGNKYVPNAQDVLQAWIDDISDDPDKVEYVKKAKAVLDALMEASNEVIETLNDDIVAVSEQIKAEGLTAENIEEVQRIKDLFDELHPTQQDKVQLTDEYLDALDTLNAIAAFKNMVGELYREVVKEGNVTSFVQFYIDIVTNLYNQFPAGIRQAFDVAENENCIIIAKEDSATGEQIVGYTDIMAAIQAAYDEVGDEGAFHLNAVQKMIEDFKAELIAALQEAMAMDVDDAIPSIADALKSFEANITANYQAAIKEAIEGENGVNKQIEDLQSEIATLKEQIKTLQAAAGDKTALEGITGRLDALEQNVQALQAALGELNTFKTDYESFLKDIKDGKYATDEELTTALNTFETQKLAPALNRLTAAEGDITTLKSQVSNIEGRLAVVEEQAKKAYEELFGTDGKSDTIADLEAQIAALESKLGTAGEGEDDSIEARIADLKTQLATLKSQLDAFQAKVDAAVSLGDRVAALESAKTALENADKQLQTNIDNLKKDLEDKINGLQEQIDSLKSTSTTLTVLVIILAVMVLAALACIVLLFIKRNKSNN